jgi:hypothetical protein
MMPSMAATQVIVQPASTPWWQWAATAFGSAFLGGVLALIGGAWDRRSSRSQRLEDERTAFQRATAREIMTTLAALGEAKARSDGASAVWRRAKEILEPGPARTGWLKKYAEETDALSRAIVPAAVQGHQVADETLRGDFHAFLGKLDTWAMEEQRRTGSPPPPGVAPIVGRHANPLTDEEVEALDSDLATQLGDLAGRFGRIARS